MNGDAVKGKDTDNKTALRRIIIVKVKAIIQMQIAYIPMETRKSQKMKVGLRNQTKLIHSDKAPMTQFSRIEKRREEYRL